MKLQWRLVLLTVLSFAVCLVLVGYRTQSVLTKDKETSASEYLTRQTATLSFSAGQLLRESVETLIQFARVPNKSSSAHWGEFQMITMISMSSHGQWEPTWIEKRDSTLSKSWNAAFDRELIRSAPFAKVKKGRPHWVRGTDPNGEPVFLLATMVAASRTSARFGENQSDVILVGVYRDNPLVRLLNEFKGSKNRFFFVDDRGFIASDTRARQTGQAMSDDDIKKELIRGTTLQGGGVFEDAEEIEHFTNYRRIPESNLTVAATIPVQEMYGVTQTFRATLSAVGAGAIILLMTLVFIWGKDYSDRILKLRGFVQDLTNRNYEKRLVSKSKDEVGLLANDLAHLQAQLVGEPEEEPRVTKDIPAAAGESREWHLGVHSLLKEPLLSLIGHIQLLRPLVRGEEGRDHILAMERDTRAVKGLVDRLVPRTSMDPSSEVAFTPLVENALGSFKPVIQKRSLQIHLDLNDQVKVKGHAEVLERGLQLMIGWILGDHHATAATQLALSLRENAGRPELEIAVTGLELPFHSAREFQLWALNEAHGQSDLLELAAARHLFEMEGGYFQIESAGEGPLRVKVTWSDAVASASPEADLEQVAWASPETTQTTTQSKTQTKTLELETNPVAPEIAVQLPALPQEEELEPDEGLEIVAVDSDDEDSDDSKGTSWVAAGLGTDFGVQDPAHSVGSIEAMVEPGYALKKKDTPTSGALRRPKLKV